MSNGHKIVNGYIEKFTKLPYSALFLLWIVLALVFAALYVALDGLIPTHGPGIPGESMPHKYFNSLYFSVITATSTGYGDIVPQGFSKALACMQSLSALMIFAAFVTKLVSHNQTLALQQIHKLSFETQIHNIREGLYVSRKDCERIIQDAEENGVLIDEHWRDLTILYQQTQSILNEIPEFYEQENKLYTIDKRREQLLHEGVHRTLHRINTMLDVLSSKGIAWEQHEQSLKELKGLIEVVDKVTPLWEEESPYVDAEAFSDILHVNSGIHERVGAMLPREIK